LSVSKPSGAAEPVESGAGSGAAVGKVYAALRMPILDGQIAPGTRINIDAVARKLGVSQTPVREALQRLEGDDLLVYTPGKGYRTTEMLDLAGLRSVFEFRLLVEPWAARSAAADRLTNPAERLDEELKAFEEAASAKQNVRQHLLQHDTRFHDLVLAATENEVVRQAYTNVHCHLHVFRLYPVDEDGLLTIEEHRRIWEAIRVCDADAAEHEMVGHIKNSYARSAQAFAMPAPPVPTADPGRGPGAEPGPDARVREGAAASRVIR
jgi:DNA-binding GntR family transcriptional regulator